MVDFKKLVLGIIIIGVLVTIYGVYEYLEVSKTPIGLGTRALPADPLGRYPGQAELQKAKLPNILVGAGIIILGLIIKASAKKEG